MKEIQGGVAAPRGFLASGVSCGIKKGGGKDLALLVSEVEAAAAGVFTTNEVQAAPVRISRERLHTGLARAVLVNSGCANACAGPAGEEAAREVARRLAIELGIGEEEVLVSSTGRIGVPLPAGKMIEGLPALVGSLSREGGACAAEAIMTTDTRPKDHAVSVAVEGNRFAVGGMAKGAGMICPRMATMLGFLTTDARVEAGILGDILREVVEESFNRITVDGDRSTNDSVLILANGLSGVEVRQGSGEMRSFVAALRRVSEYLACEIVRDGEGATKFVEVRVEGAPSEESARRAAFAVANSNLLKVALSSGDLNWGRILSALGSAGAGVVEERVGVVVNGVEVVRGGMAAPEPLPVNPFDAKEIRISVRLDTGKGSARVWTCDLTRDYIDLNMH